MNGFTRCAWAALVVSVSSCTCGVNPFGDQLAGVNVCGKACGSDAECGTGYVCQAGLCAGDSCGPALGSSSGTVGGTDGGNTASGGASSGAISTAGGSSSAAANTSSISTAGSNSGPVSSSGGTTSSSGNTSSGGVVIASSNAGGTTSTGSMGGSSLSASGGATSLTGSSAGIPASSSGGVGASSSLGGASSNASSGAVGVSSGGNNSSAGGSSNGGPPGSSSGGGVSSSGGAGLSSSSGGMTGSSSGGGGGSSSSGGGPCVGGYINAGGSCVVWTVCTAAQYEELAPTATSDRVCLPLTTCAANEFEVTPPTATQNRVCALLTVCSPLQYQAVPPSPTTDRVCLPLTTCTALEYEAAAPTAVSNRVCAPITTCTATQFEVYPPGPTSNRVCQDLTVCGLFQFEFSPPTPTSDRVCGFLTFCTSEQYETVPPTPTSNRVCAPLTVCDAAQCQTVAPTTTTDRVCGPLVLELDPATSQTLVVTNPASPPTLTLNATACGSPVTAAWTLDQGSLGSLSSALTATSVFTPSGTAGGLVTVIAGYQGSTARRSVLVQLAPPPQNGPNTTPAELAQVAGSIAVLTAGGGVGGVGGEGLGPAFAPADNNFTALQGTPNGNGTAQALSFLYPYNGTVWPRGMLAPLLQWSWSFGDADGVRIELSTTTGSYAWTGYFARPAILAQLPPANRKFIRIPIPQDVWETATNSAGGPTLNGLPDRLTVRLTVARNGQAYGPITQTWTVAPARLTGTIYYQSYGTNLANNYTGAQGTPSSFGAAVLSIRGGDTDPQLVSSFGNCQVCHSVAARGGRLVVQASTNSNDDTWAYELTATGITSAQLARGVPEPGYPGLYPDGSLMLTPGAALQPLPNNAGADIPTTGLTTVSTSLGVPAFSPDGTKVVFNPQNMVANPGRMLMVMDFNRMTSTFSNPIVVSNDAVTSPGNNEIRPAWPQFFPTSNALVYQHQLEAGLDGNQGDAHTRKFARGELYFAPVVSNATVVPLRRLNGHNPDGSSYLPVLSTPSTLSCTADSQNVGANAGANGDAAHTLDASYNYEPTVNPVSSGGYAWVVFTSRRLYGSVATIPPFCSDPRGVDLHANMVNNTNITTKKLWVAAIDINPAPGTDGSHPAFYLPAQELLAGNARGFWVLDPCRADNASCLTGDQCCNGYCQPNGVGGALVCSDRPPDATCSNLQEACASTQDCCLATAECINNFCAEVEQ